MLPNFTLQMIPWWQWGLVAAVPLAILSLYFLKLKRQPLEVPSTYLWHKSIEDLHVNSIWQRLRQSLLLLLQMLLLLLLILALLRPTWQGTTLPGKRFVFLVDNSASMAATDQQPTRLDEAKRRVGLLIDQMESDDEAMLISFAADARVEQAFTSNANELKRRLAAIKQTQDATSLNEALRVAAGLANPSKLTDPRESGGGEGEKDVWERVVIEAQPAALYLFTDGKFPDVKDFSLGNLAAQPAEILGTDTARNVAIVAFSAGRNEEKLEELQAFGRVVNFSAEPANVVMELLHDGKLIDADQLTIPAGKSAGVAFPLAEITSGVLELRMETNDHLSVDDRAWATLKAPTRAKVLLVSQGNESLDFALATQHVMELADIVRQSPEFLKSKEYEQIASTGVYDLMVFDRCQPPLMPQSNTLFLGALPPGEVWKAKDKAFNPQVIDIENTHPLTQMVDLSNVQVADATTLEPPTGSSVLIDSTDGPLLVIAPRAGFEDAVLGFSTYAVNAQGEVVENTTWPLRLSFPIFTLNALQYLGGGEGVAATGSIQPGREMVLRPDTAAATVLIRTPEPASATFDVQRSLLNRFTFTQTHEIGVYDVQEPGKSEVLERFAVNLFDSGESEIKPRPAFKIGHVDVAAQTGAEPARRDGWKWLVLGGLAILAFEWYIYNRRVYL